MAQVVTLEDFVPPPRYDSVPWLQARIEEGATLAGTFTVLETIAINPPDDDPSHPASRSFTTSLASETPNLWYRIVFLDDFGDDTLPTTPIQNGVVSNYATVEELAAILRVRVTDRRAALQRVLDTAAYEIDQELGRTDPFTSAPPLVVEVNLERAVEHWQQMQSPFGLIGIGGEGQPAFTTSDSWVRHAHKLQPLKESWGLA